MPVLPKSRSQFDQDTPRKNHIDHVLEDPNGEVQHVRVNLGESPLLWLRSRGLLSERLYLAGDMLREDWERAGLGSRVTMAWDVAPPGKGARSAPRAPDPHIYQLSAKERFDGALRNAGPGLTDILWRVVCAGEGLSSAERALGWPSRAGKLVLGFALERVADYYRIA